MSKIRFKFGTQDRWIEIKAERKLHSSGGELILANDGILVRHTFRTADDVRDFHGNLHKRLPASLTTYDRLLISSVLRGVIGILEPAVSH